MGKIFGSQGEEKAKIFSKGLTRSMCVHKSEDTANKYNTIEMCLSKAYLFFKPLIKI